MSDYYGLSIDPERIDTYGYQGPNVAAAAAGGVADYVTAYSSSAEEEYA